MNEVGRIKSQSVQRLEDARLLRGAGAYIADLSLPQMVHGVVIASTYANARIKHIDVTQSLAMPGVLAVLTGADVATLCRNGLPPLFMPKDVGGPAAFEAVRPILCEGQVRHVGDRVCFCIAETLAQAIEAADKVIIDYEELPSVTDLREAVVAGASPVWPDVQDNVSFELRMGDRSATDAAFDKAAHRVVLTARNQRVTASPMEPRGAIGAYDASTQGFTLYTSTQNPHRVRETLAQQVLRIPEMMLRVVGPDVGGGFGMKGDCYPEEALVLLASRIVGRPVRWLASRGEAFLGDNAGRDQSVEAEMALDENGLILGVRVRALHNVGAYMVGAALVPITFSLKLIPNVYRVPHVDLSTRAIFTNTAPTNPYRGAGRPEAVYVTERLLDEAARQIGLSQSEIRSRNYLKTSDLPHRTQTGLTYDSGDFAQAAQAARGLGDWDGFEERQRLSQARGRLRGRSITSYIEDTGAFNDRMELRFDPSGALTAIAGTFSHGQSHETTYKQLLSQWLSIPMESIRFVQGDTSTVAFGRGTYASGSALIGGNALKAATEGVLRKAAAIAAHLLESPDETPAFRDGAFHVRSSNRSVSLTDVARSAYHPARLPAHLRVGLEDVAFYAAEPPSFPNGCHICELEIDEETGAVTIDRYVAVDDFGVLINPMIVAGQVHGAIAQGIGQALGEHMIYDASGQLLTASFMDYFMPHAAHFPTFKLAFQEVACATNPLGVKGAGEGGTVAAPVAIANAVADAFSRIGASVPDMPFTPMAIWSALEAAREARRSTQAQTMVA